MQWFSKTEIDLRDYRSDRLMKAIGKHEKYEQAISFYRGTRLFELVGFVAINNENTSPNLS